MLGAIVGDISGSRFEWENLKSKEFDLLTYRCHPTDDSNMTLAVAQAILRSKKDWSELPELAVEAMRVLGRKYPRGYGGRFRQWLLSEDTKADRKVDEWSDVIPDPEQESPEAYEETYRDGSAKNECYEPSYDRMSNA